MHVLSYLYVLVFILFFGGFFASFQTGKKPYGFLLLLMLVLTISGLFLALGTLDVLPEVSW